MALKHNTGTKTASFPMESIATSPALDSRSVINMKTTKDYPSEYLSIQLMPRLRPDAWKPV
jgi:hypothetical protein